MRQKQKLNLWGLEWYSKNKNGITRHLIFDASCKPAFFGKRLEARKFANDWYGYIKTRKDLREEPHGWRMPRPVRIVAIEYKRER